MVGDDLVDCRYPHCARHHLDEVGLHSVLTVVCQRERGNWVSTASGVEVQVSIIPLTALATDSASTAQSSRVLESRDPIAFTLLGNMYAPYGGESAKRKALAISSTYRTRKGSMHGRWLCCVDLVKVVTW